MYLSFPAFWVKGIGYLFGDDTSLADKGIREGALAVIDVCDDGHVPDVLLIVHDGSDFFNSEVDHFSCFNKRFDYID